MRRVRGAGRKPVRDDFDGAWKNMLTEKRFSDFVEYFLPDLHRDIDWTLGATFLEQELRAITRKTRKGLRVVDRLAKVTLNDGSESWILVLVEIQSQRQEEFAFGMFQRRYRSMDLFGDRRMVCLGVLADPVADWRPNEWSESCHGTNLHFEFPIVKLLDFRDRMEELEHSRNPFARFVVAHLKTLETQGDYETRMQWKLRILQGLYDMSLTEQEIGQLLHDFDWLLALPADMEIAYYSEMTEFEEKREMPHLSTPERIGLKKGLQQGREEGREEGREAGRKELLLSQCAVKFGPLAADTIARINELTPEQFDRTAAAILNAVLLEDLGL